MGLVQVRLLEPWNGYKENSILTVTEKVYYQTRTEGVKMNLVAESDPVSVIPEAKKKREKVKFDEEE